MSKRVASKSDTLNIIAPLILFFYLCIGFIPNWQAVDKIAPQWVGMTLLNLVSLSVLFYYRDSLKQPISKVITSYLSLFYTGFIFWGGLSYFYAINPTEVLVNITRQVNVLLMFLSMAILLFNQKNKARFISWAISIILSAFVHLQLLCMLFYPSTKEC